MNQGKLDVVKQEVARVNIDILGISELKWTGMPDDRVFHGQELAVVRGGDADHAGLGKKNAAQQGGAQNRHKLSHKNICSADVS